MAHLPLSKSKLRDVRHFTSDALEDTAEIAEEYYDKSRDWLQKNYGKALGGAAVIATIGLIGYFVGRNISESEDR